MTFKVFAGNMYVGKLHVFNHFHSFFPAGSGIGTHQTSPHSRVLRYKKLSLRRLR